MCERFRLEDSFSIEKLGGSVKGLEEKKINY